MNNKSESLLPKIGYVYHYPDINQAENKFRLDMYVSSIPTEKHFDILRVRLSVKSKQGTEKLIKILHPWEFGTAFEVCAGVVVMEDRKGNKEEAFTFGGKLTIIEEEMQTKCILESSAPILEISGATSTHRLFIDELKIILAKQQAAYPDHEEYERLLCNADPFDLYLACLDRMTKEIKDFSPKTEKHFQLLRYLHSQEHRMQAANMKKTPTPSFEEIFRKSNPPLSEK